MVCTEKIGCPNVERKAYILWNPFNYDRSINKCIGEIIEQENDCGEVQYLFHFYYDTLTDDEIFRIEVPGIDISLRKEEYVRSYYLPYFIERCTIPDGRGDLQWYLSLVGMDYNDKFEYMMRTRGITHHTDCYVGRFKEDFVDVLEYMKYGEYQKSKSPNLDERPENVFHRIEG